MMNTDVDKWPHLLFLNEEPIGSIGVFSGDGLCLTASFRSLPAYNYWSGIFSESIRLLKAGKTILHREQMDRIFASNLSINSLDGEVLYTRTPKVIIKGQIAFLHIEGASLKFRTF
jgi:hypothetical protein